MTAHTGPDDIPAVAGNRAVDTDAVVGGPGTGAAGHDTDPRGAEVVLREERLLVTTQRVGVERVRISKRIVTRTRTVEVPVRVEELVMTRKPLTAQEPAAVGAGDREGDLVIVLHEEVPEVTLRVVPVERVVVTTHSVAGEETVSAELRAEAVDITTTEVSTTGVVDVAGVTT